MTDSQNKTYEEAAKAYVDNLGDDPPDHRDLRSAYVAGAVHVEKEAYNRAIDAAIKLFNTRGSFGTPFIEELEKLKL